MKVIFKNIKQLVQVREQNVDFLRGEAMKELPVIEEAYLRIEGERIVDFGPMETCPPDSEYTSVDATGRVLLPCWCDSHTHIVYAGNREAEFVDKIHGFSYADIAKRGGGILNSAEVLQRTPEEVLYEAGKHRVKEVIRLGTGALEIKSGYGLTIEAECKMLRVIQRLKEHFDIPIRATFLAAHALPKAFAGNTQAYVDQVVQEWIPAVSDTHLAEYIDVFCEEGYFSTQDTDHILQAGGDYGLQPKIHVNQFNAIGGIEVGVRHGALSVDHLEILRQEDIEALNSSSTMPVALPGCSFFLGIPYTPAREILNAGLPLALATDYNPGSAPSGNMNFVVAAACIKMKMTPEEAINAATINGAFAMELSEEVGSITPGKLANLILTKPVHSYVSLPYSFATNQIDKVYIRGRHVE